MEQLANMEGSGLIPLLVDSKYEDLSRMYCLFKRVEGGLELLKKMMNAHITSEGMALVNDPEKVSGGLRVVGGVRRRVVLGGGFMLHGRLLSCQCKPAASPM
jgi:hypothetical protein